jgi:hypothetical protein
MPNAGALCTSKMSSANFERVLSGANGESAISIGCSSENMADGRSAHDGVASQHQPNYNLLRFGGIHDSKIAILKSTNAALKVRVCGLARKQTQYVSPENYASIRQEH